MIRISNLEKSYRVGKVVVPALRGIDLSIEDAEFMALAGPSGSGKTTLLNIIGCLDRPDSGSVALDGTVISDLRPRAQSELRKQRIGFVFQTFNLIPVLTAFENVELPLVLLKLSPQERSQRVHNILKDVGLDDYATRRPGEMSGGQQQRVAIARALVKGPTLLLADEPTANLDSTTAGEILELMAAMNVKHRATFLFSTHDPLVMAHARRLVHLKDGRISNEVKR